MALAAWAAAVTAVGVRPAVTPVGELTSQVGDWEEAVGDNNERALMAGAVASVNRLSEVAPPDGEVVWQDGTTTKVPRPSAQAAIVAIETTTAEPCSDCAMLLGHGGTTPRRGPSRRHGATQPPRCGCSHCRARR